MDKQDVETTIQTLNFLQAAFAVGAFSLALSAFFAGASKQILQLKINAS